MLPVPGVRAHGIWGAPRVVPFFQNTILCLCTRLQAFFLEELVWLPSPKPTALNLSLNDGSAFYYVVRHQRGPGVHKPDPFGRWEKFQDKQDAVAQVATI